MLKKVIATAMLAGAASASVVPAHADPVSVCYSVYVDIDGTVTETANCVP